MRDKIVEFLKIEEKRRMLLKRFSGAVALLLAIAVTLSLIDRAYSVPQLTRLKPYDGVTLYRGLFFASGPFASRVPTTQKIAPYLPAEYKSLESQTITYIQKNDPKFFDNFAREIQSGDRVRIAAAIRNATKLQKQAIAAETKNSRTPFAAQVRSYSLRTEREPEAENDANVAVEVVVWVAVLVVILAFWVKAPPEQIKGITFEKYVNEIANAVPKAPTVRQ